MYTTFVPYCISCNTESRPKLQCISTYIHLTFYLNLLVVSYGTVLSYYVIIIITFLIPLIPLVAFKQHSNMAWGTVNLSTSPFYSFERATKRLTQILVIVRWQLKIILFTSIQSVGHKALIGPLTVSPSGRVYQCRITYTLTYSVSL